VRVFARLESYYSSLPKISNPSDSFNYSVYHPSNHVRKRLKQFLDFNAEDNLADDSETKTVVTESSEYALYDQAAYDTRILFAP
jgi:hypothetical protein